MPAVIVIKGATKAEFGLIRHAGRNQLTPVCQRSRAVLRMKNGSPPLFDGLITVEAGEFIPMLIAIGDYTFWISDPHRLRQLLNNGALLCFEVCRIVDEKCSGGMRRSNRFQ